MVKLELKGGQKYRVLNKVGVSLRDYIEQSFIPSGDFIDIFERMYGRTFTDVSPYPYWRKDMGSNTKLLAPPLDNDIEVVGIQPNSKPDILLSFDFKREDITNLEDLRIGIEEILLAHHKDWQYKRRRQGRTVIGGEVIVGEKFEGSLEKFARGYELPRL